MTAQANSDSSFCPFAPPIAADHRHAGAGRMERAICRTIAACLLAGLLAVAAILALTPTARATNQTVQVGPCIPSVVVGSTADSGAGSLRQAVIDVCDGGEISFSLSMPATITLTSGEIAITKTLTISGPGASNLAVSGNNSSRVFNIDSSGVVTLTALTIRDGSPAGPVPYGGGIYSTGKLTIIATNVISNSAAGGYGGGLYSQNATSALTVTGGSLIQENTAYAGGGICNADAKLTVDGSSVLSNSTVGSYGGGGIWNSGQAIIVNGSLIQGNRASNEGGGIYNANGILTLDASIVATNTADGGYYGGGGILNVGSTGRLAITNGSRIVENGSWQGGGISNAGSLTISASTIVSNSGTNSGGGIYNTGSSAVLTITAGSSIEGNRAFLGGGVFNEEDGDITIDSSRVISNVSDPSSGEGGGIYNKLVGSVITITNGSLVQGNSAAKGGGIANQTNAVLSITGSTVTSNTAVASGGGSIYNWGVVILENSTFVANRANTGGAIYSAGTLTMTNSTVVNNYATFYGGGINNEAPGKMYLRNTLVADSERGGDCRNGGTISANISNLVEDGTCGAALSGDPLLGVLGDYGGGSKTVPLLPGSLAIDAGDAGTCLAADQRGVGRVNICDIGAFESRGFVLAKGSGDGQTAPTGIAFGAPLTIAVSSDYIEPVDGGSVTYAGPNSGAGTAPVTNTVTIVGGTGAFTPTANSTPGSYSVTATSAGSSPAITFGLTNTLNVPDTTLVKMALPDMDVTFQGIVTYTLLLRNIGSLADSNVTVTDSLPAGATFAGWVEQPSGANFTGEALTWTGAVAPAEIITFTFQTTNTAGGGATITNTAWFSGDVQAGSATATYSTSTSLTPMGSGNWSEVFPSCSGVCKYVIPPDVTVTLDQDISLNGDFEIESGGTFIANGKTVTLTGEQAQTLTGNPLTFYSLLINKTNKSDTVTVDGKLKVTRKLTVRSGKLLSASDYVDIEIEDQGELELTSDITVSGHFTMTGDAIFTPNAYTVTFDGATEQNIAWEYYAAFWNMTVMTGTTLIEVNSADNVGIDNALTNYGVIRKTQLVDSATFYPFGLAGNYPVGAGGYGMEIEVTDLTGDDPLTAIQVDRIDTNHPNAPGSATTDIFWTITPSGTNYVATVVLPQNGLESPGACRYSGGAWYCDRTSFDSDVDLTVTRAGVTAFSDWAVFETEATTTTLATSANPVEVDTLITVTATVEPSDVPGSVAFFADGASLGSVPVTAGSAQTSTTGLAVGTHVITATYTPTGPFLPSSGALTPDQEVTCVSTRTVVNTNDSGAGSLRQAIGDVCAGGTVGFAPALTAGGAATVTLTSGQALTLTKDVTIAGPGAELLAVSGNSATRVFAVNSGVTATIDALTIRDGKVIGIGAKGAGILNGGVLTLTKSTLTGHAGPIVGSILGGAIYNDGSLSVISSTVANNTGYWGSGIYNAGALLVTDTIVDSNIGTSDGGGIYNTGTLHLLTSTVSRNSGSYGSGIVNSATGTLTVTRSTVRDNFLNVVEGGPVLEGGGAFNLGRMTVQDSAFLSNTAGHGGGIYNGGTLMVTGATFGFNSSSDFIDLSGGGIFNAGTAVVENSTFYANVAYAGGGIQNSRILTITNSTFDANVVSNPDGWGGGVYQYDSSGTQTIAFRNTIIGGSAGGDDCTVRSGTIVENTNNLVEDGTCTPAFSGDPLLGDLGDYGGDTQTVPLLPGSPAIDAGDAATCLATDQRGIDRVGTCDIGAFESRGFSLAKGTGDGQSTPWGMAFSAPVTVSVSSDYTEPVDGGQITYVGPLSGAGITPITNTATIVGGAGVFTPTANNTLGTYNVTAGAAGATPDITYALTNTQRAPATTLTSSPNPSIFGQSVTFTATVTDSLGTPSGTVTFTVNSTQVSAAMVDGVATYITNTLVVGSHAITATYGGDARYTGSVDDMTQVVNSAATSTALSSSPNPSVYGQAVTFTATVTVTPPGMGLPTGVVTFTDGTTELGTGTLDASGVATYTTGSLDAYDGGQSPPSPATHSITAAYGGDDSFAESTSEVLSQVVGKATTTTTLASGLNPSVYGDSITFTATVTVESPGAGSMPDEDVTFKDSAVTLGIGKLDASGVATYSTSLLSGGVHTITAEYGGRTNITGSVSSGVVQTVNPADQTISFGQLADKQYGADAFPVTATASSGLTVVFTSTTPSVCTVSGNTVSLVENGGCTIRASQAGDGNYNAASDVDRSFNLTCADAIVVDRAADSGYLTLRGAVANLCDGGTITFDAALENQTITLTTGQIEISKTLTIDGPGADKLAVSGGGLSRIFAGSVGKAVTIDGLTLRDGYTTESDGGGAIYAAGPLTITSSSFISNTASSGVSDGQGGAISFSGGSQYTLIVSDTAILNNTAYQRGGGLYVASGTLDLDDSRLEGNTAAGWEEVGGALYCDDCDFAIDGTTFAGNQATHGGGLYLAAIFAHLDNTITGSTLQANRADVDSGLGGALYLGDNYKVVISDTAVLSNTAYGGGGFYTSAASELAFDSSRIAANEAAAQGGGIFAAGKLQVMRSEIRANSANGGGGVYSPGWLSVNSSSFFSNTARSGGAITIDQDNTNASITTSTFAGNSSGCNGGAIYSAGQVSVDASELYGNQAGLDCKSQALGGAIFVNNGLTLWTSALHENTSTGGGGAIGIAGSSIYSTSVEIRGSALYSNSAEYAGAVAIAGPSSTRIEQSAIYGNAAMMVGGVGSGYGGATIDIVNSTFAGNTALYLASTLFAADSDVLNQQPGFGPDRITLRNVTIAGNAPASPQSPGTFFAFVGLDGGYGGPTVAITNTIVAAGTGEQACLFGTPDAPVSPPAVASLDNDGTCGSNFRQSDSILLGPLGVYGHAVGGADTGVGASFTLSVPVYPLLPGSAAIDAGVGSLIFTPPPSSDCPFSDQRGVSRPRGSACDIGAFESQGFTLAKTGGDEQGTPWGSPFANPLAVAVSSSRDEPVDGGKITFAGPSNGAGVVPITQTATVVSGAVSVTVSANSTAGAYSVTVAAGGAQPIAFSLTNIKHATQTSVQSSLNPAPYSQAVTITASVAISGMTAAKQAAAPTGQVRFSDETGVLATVELANGVAAFSRDTWAVGTHTVTAEYLGDPLFAGSTANPLYQVVGKHATATSLATAPNPAQAGATIVMTATVEKALSILVALPPADPTGQVQFRLDGGSVLGTAELVGNTAIFTKNDFARGVYTIVAEYLGDAGYSGSSSDPVQQIVSPPLTARNDAAGTLQGRAVQIDPLANDLDPAGGGLTVSAVTQPASGSVAIDGGSKTVTFTPDPAVTGIVTFTYTARDIYGITDEALVAVVVTAVDETGHAPQIGVMDNENGSTVDFDSGAFQVQVQLPAGSYPYPLGDKDIFYLAYTQVVTPTGDIDTPPGSFRFAGMVFHLSAFLNGLDLGHFEFVQPATLVIDYDPALLGDLSEQLLTPFYWNGTAWVNDGMSITHIDTAAHRMTIQIWHLSEFALFAKPPINTPTYLYLPAVTNRSDLVTVMEAAGAAPQATPDEATAAPEATDEPVPDEATTTSEATVAPEAPAEEAGPPAEPATGTTTPVPDDAPAAEEAGDATPPQLHLPLIAR